MSIIVLTFFLLLLQQAYQPVLNQITIEQPKEFSKARPSDIFLESESSHGAKPIHEQANNILQEIQKTFGDTTTTTSDPIETPESNFVVHHSEQRRRNEILQPSKYYSPPFLEPIYNQEVNDTSNESKVDRRQSTAQDKYDFKAFDSILKAVRNASREDYDFSKFIQNARQNASGTTRAPPKKVPSTTFRSRFSSQRPIPTVQNPTGFKRVSTTTQRPPFSTTITTTTQRRSSAQPTLRLSVPTLPPNLLPPFLDEVQATPEEPPQIFAQPIAVVAENSIKKPAQELLPPFEELTHHDESTLGPPIYYDWKSQMPSLDILPPFLDSELKDDTLTAHSQTTRSVQAGLPENSIEDALKTLMKTNYAALKEKFSIPTFDFPLEAELERTGYEKSDSVNSFQLKIPRDVSKVWAV